jgi:phosphatidylserine decarboxylase
MAVDPIIYLDRYTGALTEEAVYGEGALRFAYDTRTGRWLSRMLFSQPWLSRIFGWYMKRPASTARIRPFIEKYGINTEELAQRVEAYGSFNEFFRRELKPEARPLDPDAGAVLFPADARHSGWQELGTEARVFVKGQSWDLEGLLGGDAELAGRFKGGTLVLSRLCPVDYHHFHYPVSGRVTEQRLLQGPLFSVSPIALRRRLGYLWENRRYRVRIDSGQFGEVCLIIVGATNVGSIELSSLPGDGLVERGSRAGCFEFGGSSVLTLFERDRVRLSADLSKATAEGVELYARMGDRMGAGLR